MKAFHRSLRTFFALSFIVLTAAWTGAAAQSRDMRVVSARAGGVNYLLGEVKVRRKGAEVWKSLSARDNLDSGDTVKTSPAAVVEVLLNPGSYLRAGGGTEFELADASLDELRVKLNHGSIVIEAMSYGDAGLDLRVDTPQTQTAILQTGIYRYNATAAGTTEVIVQKGRALVGAGLSAVLLKGGQVARATSGGGVPEIAKLDKKTSDALDQWSRERGKDLANANSRITRRDANSLLASVRTGGIHGRVGFDGRSGFDGYWFYDARRGCYVFLPFYGGWRSPYGGWYTSSLYWYDSCPACTNNNNDWWNNNNNSGSYRPPTPSPAPQEAPRQVFDRPQPVSTGGWANKDGAVEKGKP